MFLSILNFMLAHVPAFMRPAVSWLLDGVRSITNYISQRWNALGDLANVWYQRVVVWAASGVALGARLATFAVWLVRVRIPGVVAVAANAVISFTLGVIRGIRDDIVADIATLRLWAQQVTDWLRGKLSELISFARQWIDRIVGTLSNLIKALGHVLSGPEVLAQWLVSAMWGASLRLLYQQRDRIFSWFTRESVAFTQWVTLELENIIMRWL